MARPMTMSAVSPGFAASASAIAENSTLPAKP